MACPVCGSEQSEPYVEFPSMLWVRCGDCDSVFKAHSQAAPASDFYEQTYFHGRKSGRDKRFEHRARKAMRWVRSALEFAKAPRSLLDVGCSFGYVIEAGRRLGLESAGTDISEYAVKVCTDRGYRASVGTLERLPFSDHEFDVVVMKHVLEHTATPTRALAEVKRVLAPGGIVLIAVPDRRYWKGQLLRRTYRYFRPDDLGQQHDVYYTQQSLLRMLGANGFAPLTSSKAVYRRGRGAGVLWQTIRYLALRVAFGFASRLRLRREVFVLARAV